MHYIFNFIILIILIILIFYFINIHINNYLEFFSLCNSSNNDSDSDPNNDNKVTKHIIVGFDQNGDPIEEDMTFTKACAKRNEKCLVDSEGDNTCCDKNLKCIRKNGNFQYKVCSDLKDACDIQYHIYLRMFDGYYWNKLLSMLKDEEKSKYEKQKKDTEDKVKNLCQGNKLNGQLFKKIVRSYLNALMLENEVFAEIIFSISII